MGFAESILPEYDQEMASTRKVLEVVPENKMDWRANPKLNTIGWNVNHIIEMPGWIEIVLKEASFDVSPPGGKPYETPKLTKRADILALFDKNVAAGRKAIAGAKDADMGQTWSLLKGGQPMFSMPKAVVIRTVVLNHVIHHRAFLIAYLRLNDVAVPGMYGPGGDEKM